MANYVSNTTGNFSTAGTWDTVVNTPTLSAIAGQNTSVSTSGIFSATFTAPNLTDSSTGVTIFIVTRGTPTSWTATLQEDIAGAAAWLDTTATASLTSTDINNMTAGRGGFVNFKWGTPYMFATTGSGRYRIKLQVSSTTGTPSVANNSGNTAFAYLTTSDAHAVPTTGDLALVMGNNGNNVVTVTVDGTAGLVGGGTATSPTERSINHGLIIGEDGVLTWDTAASATLQCRGNLMVYSGGCMFIGTTASPYPTAYVGKIIIDENGTAGQFGLVCLPDGILELQGVAKSSTSLWKTTYSSGVGTAASPLITATAVDWSVDDEILVSPNGAGTLQKRFIITKNSSTSYVLSATVGGAESALTGVLATTIVILNLTRNVIVTSQNSAQGVWVTYMGSTSAEVGRCRIKWARLTYVGRNSVSGGFYLGWTMSDSSSSSATANSSVDYSVATDATGGNDFAYAFVGTAPSTHTGNIAYFATSGSHNFIIAGRNNSLVDCFGVLNTASSFFLADTHAGSTIGHYQNTLTRCISFKANSSGSAHGAFSLSLATRANLVDCEAHYSSTFGVMLAAPNIDTVFTRFLSGTKGVNTGGDIGFNNAAIPRQGSAIFVNSTFASSTFVSNYTTRLALGGIVAFQTLNTTANNHIWYLTTGTARSTGTGLSDTTTHTSGSLALRIAPESTNPGFIWEFLTPARVGKYATMQGVVKLNSAFTGDASASCVVDLYLPGSTTPDATTTIAKTTTDWQVFNLAALYTGSVDLYAKVVITVKTTTASAYAYFDTFYNGTNTITALDTWHNGQPSPIMFEQLGDASAVWAVLSSTQTTNGTMGKLVTKLLTVAKFLGLK